MVLENIILSISMSDHIDGGGCHPDGHQRGDLLVTLSQKPSDGPYRGILWIKTHQHATAVDSQLSQAHMMFKM